MFAVLAHHRAPWVRCSCAGADSPALEDNSPDALEKVPIESMTRIARQTSSGSVQSSPGSCCPCRSPDPSRNWVRTRGTPASRMPRGKSTEKNHATRIVIIGYGALGGAPALYDRCHIDSRAGPAMSFWRKKNLAVVLATTLFIGYTSIFSKMFSYDDEG